MRLVLSDVENSNCGEIIEVEWMIATDPHFSSVIYHAVITSNRRTHTFNINDTFKDKPLFARARPVFTNCSNVEWSDVVICATDGVVEATVDTPLMSVSGYPDNILITPDITCSDFSATYNGEQVFDVHKATLWSVMNVDDNVIVYLGNVGNLLRIDDLPILEKGKTYEVTVKHNGEVFGGSDVSSLTFTVSDTIGDYIISPTISIGLNSNGFYSIQGSEFISTLENDAHMNSTWRITHVSSGDVKLNLTTNIELTQKSFTSIESLIPGKEYMAELRYNGTTMSSPVSTIVFTVNYNNKWVNSSPVLRRELSTFGYSQLQNKLIITGGIKNDNTEYATLPNKLLIIEPNLLDHVIEEHDFISLMDHCQTTLDGGEIFISGGYTRDSLGIMFKRVSGILVDLDNISEYTSVNVDALERKKHQQSLVSGTNSVFISGGLPTDKDDLTMFPNPLNSCIIYDVYTEEVSHVAPLPIPLFSHRQTTLRNGNILVSGGITDTIIDKCHIHTYSASVFLYITNENRWIKIGELGECKYDHNQGEIEDGRVLITAGLMDLNRHNSNRTFIVNLNLNPGDPNILTELAPIPIGVSKAGTMVNSEGILTVFGGLIDNHKTSESIPSQIDFTYT